MCNTFTIRDICLKIEKEYDLGKVIVNLMSLKVID